MSLLSRLMLIIIVALMPPLGMQALNESGLRAAREAEVRDNALREARLAAAALDGWLDGVRNTLATLAEVPAIAAGDPTACALLASVNARLGLLEGITLAGAPPCPFDPATPLVPPPGAEVARARERGGFVLGTYATDSAGRGVLPVAYALPGPSGAVLVACIRLDVLRAQVQTRPLPAGASTTLIDRDGTILVRLPDPNHAGETLPPDVRALIAPDAPPVFERPGLDGVRRILAVVPLSAGARDIMVSFGFSTAQAYAASDAAARRGYALIAAGLVAALLLAVWLLRGMIARPLLAILATTERWRGGDTSARIEAAGGRSEFARLALAVNALLEAAAAGQQGLRARLAELDAVYSSASVGLGFIDHDLRFVTVNATLATLNGVSEAEHRGRTVREVLPRIAWRAEPALRRALAGESMPASEVAGLTELLPGVPRRLLVAYTPAIAAGGKVLGVVVAAQDITPLRQAEAALQITLQRANAELELRVDERSRQLEAEVRERAATQAQLYQAQKMETLGQLTGGVAHDFNNLLTAIVGNLELAILRSRDRPEVTRLLHGAMRSADRGAALTQRMLAFGRRQYLRFEAVEIGPLLDGMADLLARTLGPSVQVRMAATPGMRAARADPNQMELVVLNLAVNARDAMPEGGVVTISATEELADAAAAPALRPGRYIRIAVSDTGGGMDSETLARAFEPFFTTKAVGRGSGLGLPMVQGVAEQSGGAVTIASVAGGGTTVSVWLPCADAVELSPASQSGPAPPLTAGRRVLLVDDDPDVLDFAATCLEEAGLHVVRALGGEEALVLLMAGPIPDLLIADLGMPGMGGATLTAAARRLYPALPVLIATGYADVGDGRATNLRLPVLTKPFKAADLLAQVAPLLGGPS